MSRVGRQLLAATPSVVDIAVFAGAATHPDGDLILCDVAREDGVLISVATIPAAGNMGVAAAYGHWEELAGASAQLAINLSMIVIAGLATLVIQRAVYERHREPRRARAASRRLTARRGDRGCVSRGSR